MTTTEPLPYRIAEKLEHVSALDGAIDLATGLVRRVPRSIRDLLHGKQAGHPIHPVAVLVPMGAWMSAALLDVLPGHHRAARTLVGAGVVAAVPAIAAGWVDWSVLDREQRRVGTFHAAANETAVGIYAVSWLLRRAGAHRAGATVGLFGLALITVAGYLGGHMTYRQGAGVETPTAATPATTEAL